MLFRIKNFLVNLIFLTPLTAVCAFFGLGVLAGVSMLFTGDGDEFFNAILISAFALGVAVFVAKIIFSIKGRESEGAERIEYNLRERYDGSYTIDENHVADTKLSVYIFVIFSPIILLCQLVADVFALLAIFFPKKIFSTYGDLDLSGYDIGFLNKVTFKLFKFVIAH